MCSLEMTFVPHSPLKKKYKRMGSRSNLENLLAVLGIQ
jgi:hypothetical protein